MTLKDKAKELVDNYRIILMNEDTDCGHEILCTSIAKKCALIAVDEIIKEYGTYYKVEIDGKYVSYWQEVKHEIEKL
jgi:hypothetical protein